MGCPFVWFIYFWARKIKENKSVPFYSQIEESFRDIKTGLNFNESNTRKHARLSVLLLIASLAQYLLYLLGLAVTILGRQRRYQANSLKSRVLSYQFIGLRAVQDKRLSLRLSDWKAALQKLQVLMGEHLHV